MIRLEDVSKYYKTENGVAVGVQKINLELSNKEFVAITGESGSGKSTLLNVLSGLDGYEDGEMYVNGEETSHFTVSEWEEFRNKNVGFIFQNYNIIDAYTVLQNVMLALELQGYDKSKIKQRALELIDKVGLTTHKNHKASKLSGGQKQRCVIARALAKDCPIIMADEPTGNLDSVSGKQIIELLYEISKEKLLLIVTHDYDQVEQYVTRKIKMLDGEIVEDKKYKRASDISLEQSAKSSNDVIPIHTDSIKGDLLSTDTINADTSVKTSGLNDSIDNNVDHIKKETPIIEYKIKANKKVLPRFAFRNLFSTPKRSFFFVLVQTLVIFGLVMAYASQISSVRDVQATFTEPLFYAQTQNRVILRKNDNTIFTETELNSLKNLPNVTAVAQYSGNFFETSNSSNLFLTLKVRSYYYQNDELVEYEYNNRIHINPTHANAYNINMLTDGSRLPQNDNEVLVSEMINSRFRSDLNIKLNDELEVSFGTSEYAGAQITKSVKVVGFIKEDNTSYKLFMAFTDSHFTSKENNFFGLMGSKAISTEFYYRHLIAIEGFRPFDRFQQSFKNFIILPHSQLNGNEVYFPVSEWSFFSFISMNYKLNMPLLNTSITTQNPIFKTLTFDYDTTTQSYDYDTFIDYPNSYGFKIALNMLTNTHSPGVLFVSETMYDSYVNEFAKSGYVSVFTQDYYNSTTVATTLIDEGKYVVFYPYMIEDIMSKFSAMFQTILLIMVVLLVGSFGYAIINWTQRSILNSRKKDFAVFRSIGANEKTLKYLISFENIITTLICFGITMITVFVLKTYVYSISLMLRHVKMLDFVMLFLVVMYLSVKLSQKFNKKLFQQTVIKTLNS